MKSIAFGCALLMSFGVMAADAPKTGELIGDPRIVAPLDPVKTREAGVRASEAAEKIGWRIGSQAYTLRDRTLVEALDTLYMLGLKYVEAFPGQAVSPEYKNVKFNVGMPQEAIGLVRERLDKTGIKILSIGVIGIDKDEAKARQLFEFARSFGMERIVTEAISYAKESSEGSIWTGHGRRKRHPRRPVLRLRRQTLPPCCRCSRC